MLLADSGIKCDLCKNILAGDFIYYSYDFKEVKVNENIIIPRSQIVIFSLDVCLRCSERICTLVKTNYQPTIVGINCDICGCKLRGSFIYYYCDISEVKVSYSNSRLTCIKCNRIVSDDNKPCHCGGVVMRRKAAVSIDNKYLQLAACQKDYESLIHTASTVVI